MRRKLGSNDILAAPLDVWAVLRVIRRSEARGEAHADAQRDGDVAHLKAENERLRSVVLAPVVEEGGAT